MGMQLYMPKLGIDVSINNRQIIFEMRDITNVYRLYCFIITRARKMLHTCRPPAQVILLLLALLLVLAGCVYTNLAQSNYIGHKICQFVNPPLHTFPLRFQIPKHCNLEYKSGKIRSFITDSSSKYELKCQVRMVFYRTQFSRIFC